MKTFVALFCLVLSSSCLAMRTAGPCPPNFTGQLSNSEDCHSFYLCNDGNPSLICCPSRLCFNAKISVCDFCSSVPECDDEAVSTVSTNQPSTVSTSQSTPTSTHFSTSASTTQSTTANGSTTTEKSTTSGSGTLPCPEGVPFIYMPYPVDCNKFYFCENGLNMGVYNCGEELWFNFEGQVCARPWGSSCNS